MVYRIIHPQRASHAGYFFMSSAFIHTEIGIRPSTTCEERHLAIVQCTGCTKLASFRSPYCQRCGYKFWRPTTGGHADSFPALESATNYRATRIIGTALAWSGVLLALQFAPLGAGVAACGAAIHLCGLMLAWKNRHRMAIRARK